MTSQHGAYAFYAWSERVHVYTRMHTRPSNHTNPRARTHRQVCNTCCVSTATVIRECTSLLVIRALSVCLDIFLRVEDSRVEHV
jgi:hypothetical protein